MLGKLLDHGVAYFVRGGLFCAILDLWLKQLAASTISAVCKLSYSRHKGLLKIDKKIKMQAKVIYFNCIVLHIISEYVVLYLIRCI